MIIFQLILSACSPFFEKLFEEDGRAYVGAGTSANTTATDIDCAPSIPGLENEKQCSRHPLVIVLPEVIFFLFYFYASDAKTRNLINTIYDKIFSFMHNPSIF